MDVTVDTRSIINDPPYANPTAIVTDAVSRQVTLTANAGDTDGTIAGYLWTWSGGSSTSASPIITLPYGSHEISLVVTDDFGATTSATVSINLFPLATVDSDADGLNDLVEYTLRDQGFNWNLSQPHLAEALTTAGLVSRADLAAEGYYDLAGMRVLQVPAPVIARDAITGKVKLLIGIQQSTNLSLFTALPASDSQLSVTPLGEILFEFDAPAGSGFFRIQAK